MNGQYKNRGTHKKAPNGKRLYTKSYSRKNEHQRQGSLKMGTGPGMS